MWGTFIAEAYLDWERTKVADALDDLCAPGESYGFASGGVYCFWDLATREPLYIGRAIDLADRFRQHNGIGSKRVKGTKLEHINAHFAGGEDIPLGYSILVRSPLSQSTTARGRKALGGL